MIEFKSMTSHPYNPGQPDGNNHSLTIQPNVEKDKTSAKFAVMLRQLNAVIRYIGDLELGYGKNETKSTRIENDLDGIVPKCISVKNQTASTELIPLKTSDSAARHNANESLPAHLSKGLIKAITPEMFAKDVNIETLTSPDDQGIRCNNQQKKFLELNGNFLEITKLNENRYRAKTSLMLPDLYIRYKNNKFEVESLAERLKNILTVGLSGRAMRRKDTGQLSKKRFNTLDETTNAEQLPKRMRKHISSVDIAEKNEIRPTSLKQNAKSDGRPTEKGFARVSKFERNKNGHVNFDLVERWQKMSQQERDNITQAEFAREHNIHVGRWIDMVDKNGGLKSTGLRIKMQSEGIAFKPITAEICSEWRNFTQAKRDQITRNGFAEERTINPEIWERYVKKDGQLTFFGKNKLSNLSGVVFRPITPNILIYWRNLSQEQRNTITMKGFASKRGINYLKLSQLVTIDGQLQPNGSVMVDKANGVDFKPITEPLIIAWQNLSQEERDETTMNGYAKMHNFNARQWYKTINIRGELGVMGHSIIDKERGVVYQPILKRHLKKWQAMTHRQRDQIGVIEYAVHNKLSPQHWANCVKVAGGLQPRGRVIIDKADKKNYRPIDKKILELWQGMAQEKRINLKIGEFALENNIDALEFTRLIKRDGNLRCRGLTKLNHQAGKIYQPVTAKLITSWCNMNQKKRDKVTMAEFAARNDLNPSKWESCVNLNGTLSEIGQTIIDVALNENLHDITHEHIKDWLAQYPNGATCAQRRAFAEQNKLRQSRWCKTVKLDGGLQPNGEDIMEKAACHRYDPIEAKHVSYWKNLTQAERRKITIRGYAKKNNFNPIKFSFKVNIDGDSRKSKLAKKGKTPETRYTVAITKKNSHSPHPRMAALPDVIILLKNDFSLIEQREINNDSPILRDAENFYKSILVQEEGDIKQIKISGWFYVNTLIQSLPKSDRQRVRLEIRKNIRIWLHAEGQHTDLFNALMEARLPEGDDGPARGKTVYAKRDIKQFEVLGPYAGILHTSEDSLQKEKRKIGEKLVLSYLWEPYATDRTVSGFQQGNMLSLINTSQLSNSSPVWKHNNVGVIWVGKNLIFYVALENIEKGEELLVDYGGTYNPTGNDIKQESLALAES
jgi:hypothetical protein